MAGSDLVKKCAINKPMLAHEKVLKKKTEPIRKKDATHWALLVQPQTCGPCGQNTHEIDRDDPERRYLQWTKTCVLPSTGLRTPQGGSCTHCINVRFA